MDGPDGMHSVNVRACNACGVSVSFSRRCKRLPTARESDCVCACQEAVDDSVVWSSTSSRDCSVPCRLLQTTPAQAQGSCRLAGWVVRPCNPPGGLCTDVKMDYCNFFCLPRLLLIIRVSCWARGSQTRVVYNVVSEMDLQMQLRLQRYEIWSSATGTVSARLWPE